MPSSSLDNDHEHDYHASTVLAITLTATTINGYSHLLIQISVAASVEESVDGCAREETAVAGTMMNGLLEVHQ